MARLRNKATGVIVNVADGKTLDGYEPADAVPSAEPKPAPKKSSKNK